MRQWLDRRATPIAILIASWLVFALYAYPGYMTTASIDELVDSRVGEITDWHSPTMTEIWRVIGRVTSGPAGMLVLQSVLLLAGMNALLRRATTARAAAIVAAAILLFPPILATTAVITPESQLAAFLVAAAAALTSPRNLIRGLGLVALLVASAIADGGTIAALPLILLGTAQLSRRRWQRYVIALAVWIVIAGAAALLDRALVDSETDRNETQLAMNDAVGVLRYASPIDDAEIRGTLAGAPIVAASDLQARAKAVYSHPDRYESGGQRLFDPPDSSAAREALEEGRWTLVRSYPGAYFHHRWYQFVRVLGLSRGSAWTPVYTSFTENRGQQISVRHMARHSPIQKALIYGVRALGTTFLFHPYWYFLLALALLPFAIVRRHPHAIVLLGSGILYELALMFVTRDAAYTYSHWMITATVLAGTLLIVRRYWPAGSDGTEAGG